MFCIVCTRGWVSIMATSTADEVVAEDTGYVQVGQGRV